MFPRNLSCIAVLSVLVVGSGCSDDDKKPPATSGLAHTLFVAGDGKLKAFDIASGRQRSGEIPNVTSAVDLTALEDGHVLANLTTQGVVLIVDGLQMLEHFRIPTTLGTAKNPVHGYVSPTYEGKRYFMALNDGAGKAEENSALFIDIALESRSRFKAVGEAKLGIGHHKASFSKTRPRATVSNLGDCETTLQVLDFSDPANVVEVKKIGAAELGWNGESYARTCDPTYKAGKPPAPHGVATGANGRAYHNLTGSGEIVEVDMDSDPPAFRVIKTQATGGAGYTTFGLERYVFTLHGSPREGAGGAACQIGQLTVLDTAAGDATIAAELPLFYKGPNCTDALTATDESSANPGHSLVDSHHKQLFITPAGGFGDETARVRYELIVDISNPSAPVQLESTPIGAGTGHMDDALSGDHQSIFTVGTIDGTVSQLDCATRKVVKTFDVGPNPTQATTFGTAEGPGYFSGQSH
jgi:hypothetical protein